jgi:lipoprotein-anchoring transpeptidase ErfK/SrfK
MIRPILLAALVLATFAHRADAGQDYGRPPVVLSPDLTSPWVVQLQGDYRPILVDRTPMRPAGQQVAAIAPTPQGGDIDSAFLPAVIPYRTTEKPGTIVIDTGAHYLYLVLDGGMARRYGVGVARPGFEWSGVHAITQKREWPEWVPPAEMRQRQPYLPDRMAGGPDNPLGARALYLGSTLYRIHGSNQPWTIGHDVSSGCIRMRNDDVIDLYGRVGVGTRVVVL